MLFRSPRVILARVVGTVVATQKHRKFEGAKLLLVQPLTIDDQPRGTALLAIDEASLADIRGRRNLRCALGEALERVAAAGPRAVAIDLILTEPGSDDEDACLERGLRAAGLVDLVEFDGRARLAAGGNLPAVARWLVQNGYAVQAVHPIERTLEDFYLETIHVRHAAQE